jgi:hypothetical protein
VSYLITRTRTIIIIICMVSYPNFAGADDDKSLSKSYSNRIWETIKTDQKNFYSSRRLLRIGAAFGIGGIMANTNTDEKIQDWYQDDVRSSCTDNLSDVVKTFGEGKYLIPLSLLTAGLFEIIPESSATSSIDKWGRLTCRAYLVGGPPMLIMQRATGASRPNESDDDSRWKPFNDSNGVSGHAFVGAVPFLSAARMSSNRLLRYGLYAASTLTAWSKMNDDDHYTSQAMLGWFMAWEAVGAVSEGNENDQKLKVSPLFLNEGIGIQVSKQF